MGVAIQQRPSEIDRGRHQHAANVCDHLVQFYDEEQYLHNVLSDFFDPVLQDGEDDMAGMVLGRLSTIRHVEERLAAQNYVYEAVLDQEGRRWTEAAIGSRTVMGRLYRRGRRRFLLIDGEILLAVYLPDRELLATEFRNAVHQLVPQLQPEEPVDSGKSMQLSQLPLYVYGELVDMVCSRSQHLIALEIETVWNTVMVSYNMNLLCGYKMESFQGSLVEDIFTQVCRHHGTIGPTEAYSKLDTAAQKMEMVASLQQKVMAFNTAQESHWSNADAKQRIKHREQFVDVLCHELRNPVGGIMGNVELLQMGLDVRREVISGNKVDINISEEGIASLKKQLSDDYASVDAIATCAEHMKSVTDDVLNLSKLEDGKVILVNVLFDLNATIMSVIKMFSSVARKKGLMLVAKLPQGDLHVLGDRGRIAQVLINLISNAIKFTSVGSISVSVICLGPALVGTGASVFKIAVADTGCGLTQYEASALFQKFVQPVSSAVTEHAGSGLGLYISKNLAELMGGLLYVESTKGEGSKFVFTFQAEPCVVTGWSETPGLLAGEATVIEDILLESVPREPSISSTEETDHSESPDLTSSPPSTISRTPSRTSSTTAAAAAAVHILLVDDNPILLRTLTRLLESSNKRSSSPLFTTSPTANLFMTVSTASNGYEAVSKLLTASTTTTPFSLVVMDLEMPFLDGLSTMREIQRLRNPADNGKGLSIEQRKVAEALKKIKVVGLTGDARESRYEEARKAGMVECLGKPVKRGDLLALVTSVVGGEQSGEGEGEPVVERSGVVVG